MSAPVQSPLLRQTAARIWANVRPRAIRWRLLQSHIPDDGLIISLNGPGALKVRIRRSDVVGRAIFENGLFEPAEVEFVRRFLKPGMVFFDVGANLGQYTVVGAAQVGPLGAVHSFEPSTRMYAELRFNVGLNAAGDVCRLNQLAVADKNGLARLSVQEPGKEVYGSLGTQSWAAPTVGHETVCTISLDGYVAEQGIAHVDLIKMDIEGAELLALQGARNLLARPDAPALLVEIADVNTVGFNYAAVDIWDYLVDSGYTLFALTAGGTELVAAQRQVYWRGDNLVALKTDKRPFGSTNG